MYISLLNKQMCCNNNNNNKLFTYIDQISTSGP